MLRIRAFQGLSPAPDLAAIVACVPYDVVNTEEAAALASGNPDSLLHVDRAEIDCPPGTDIHSDEVYAKAVLNFKSLQERGSLLREETPCIYIYRLIMGSHSQTGIAAVCHIEDYENNIIKKHEKTRKDKEDDRTRLIGDLSANTGPVFLAYREQSRIDELVEAVANNSTPLHSFTAPDGILHEVWRIGVESGARELLEAFGKVPCAYVADGHHRTASAVRVGKERRAANPNHTGDEDYNWFLSVLFPRRDLQILPYNRLVLDLHGLSNEEFLRAVKAAAPVRDGSSPAPQSPHKVSMYVAGHWYELDARPAGGANPVDRLDVSFLQDRILAPILGIEDPRTSERIEFVGGIRGVGELKNKVDSGRAAVAFSLFPTTVNQLMDIADAGEIMPPKSTWFEPKLRSGLFIHTF